MTPQAPTIDVRNALMLLALAVLWGSSFFFYKVLIVALPPLSIAFGRVAIAALCLNVWLALRGKALPTDRRLWAQFTIMGMLGNAIPFALIASGEAQISSGLAAILNATTPIFTVLVAHVATHDERLTGPRLGGVIAGLVGVLVLIGPQVLAGMGRGALWGEAACLVASASYGLAGVYGRRFRGIDALTVTTGTVSASALALVPLVLVFDRPWLLAMPGAATWGGLLGIALLCTVLAYVLYFRILAGAGASNVSMVTLLLPFTAMLLGALFLGEHVPSRAVGALALIGLGFVLIDGRLLRRLRHVTSGMR